MCTTESGLLKALVSSVRFGIYSPQVYSVLSDEEMDKRCELWFKESRWLAENSPPSDTCVWISMDETGLWHGRKVCRKDKLNGYSVFP